MEKMKIDYSIENATSYNISEIERLKNICNDAIIKANEKANNLEPWTNGPSAYLIDYIDYILNESDSEIKLQDVNSTKRLDDKEIGFDVWTDLPSSLYKKEEK